jgi:hypothetical protein
MNMRRGLGKNFGIKIKNSMGTFVTGAKFSTKSSAMNFVKGQKNSDEKANSLGLRNTKGKKVHITNKYSVIKVR